MALGSKDPVRCSRVVFHFTKTFHSIMLFILPETVPAVPERKQAQSRDMGPEVQDFLVQACIFPGSPWIHGGCADPCTRAEVVCHIPRLIPGAQITPPVHVNSGVFPS